MGNKKYEFYDIHSHILPGIDDGAKDNKESIDMINEEIAQGCKGIIVTPHYYAKTSISDFRDKRQEAFEKMCQSMDAQGLSKFIPNICLGAEVAYYSGMSTDKGLESLCMGHSEYMLLEMPFSKWSPRVLREVKELISTRNITPIIAHIERFLTFNDMATIDQLIDQEVVVQVNAGNFTHFGTRRTGMKLLTNGVMRAIGSDTHNTSSRKPNIGIALDKIATSGQEDRMLSILENNSNIYHTAQLYGTGVTQPSDIAMDIVGSKMFEDTREEKKLHMTTDNIEFMNMKL